MNRVSGFAGVALSSVAVMLLLLAATPACRRSGPSGEPAGWHRLQTRRLLVPAPGPASPGREIHEGESGRDALMQRYAITDLGTLGGSWGAACAINNFGQVVGTSARADGKVGAFLYYIGSAHLENLSPSSRQAYSINDRGQVVGWMRSITGQHHAFLYTDGTVRDLGIPGTAYAVNNGGAVVGSAVNASSGATHAFLCHDGVTTDLGTLGGSSSEARAINSAGQVVGSSSTRSDWFTRAFLYQNGRMGDLGTLGGSNSEARSINDAGQVVGWAAAADEAEHAFLYSEGAMHDLGTLGGLASAAEANNNAGQIVGWWEVAPSGAPRAFLYSRGVLQDLNRLIPGHAGWVLTKALAINDAGQIVGSGGRHGESHAFLLTPGSLARAADSQRRR